MKKTLVVAFGVLSLLLMTGCSLDDATSLGDSVMNDIDPTLLDLNKNVRPFALDSSIVDTFFSIPDADDVKFGTYTSKIMPIGGRNGEVGTGYIEFRTTLDLWKNFRLTDSLDNSIYAITVDFDTAHSNKADCNAQQKLKVIYITDSTYKYTRTEDAVKQLLSNDSSINVNLDTYSSDFIDQSLHSDLFRACTTKHGEYTARTDNSKDTIFKPDTFRFVIAAETGTANFTYLYSSPSIKVYTKYGTAHALPQNRHDTIWVVDSVRDTLNSIVSIWRSDTGNALWYKPDSLYTDTIHSDTFTNTLFVHDSMNAKVFKNDSMFVIDSVKKQHDSLSIQTWTVRTRDTTSDSLKISSRIIIDSIRTQTNTVTIDTTCFSSKVYTLPVIHSNHIIYETSDSIQNRSMRPYSSYGPQRTAVFKISVDTLWKKLNEAPGESGYKFNELLSAGILLRGTIDSVTSKTLDYKRAKEDSIIAFKWFVSDKIYSDGLDLSAHYRRWSRNDTLRSGDVAVLSIEKFLQELMSHYGTISTEVKGPQAVYLYLELLNNSTYWKQVIWSMPTLRTVLTNIN